MRSNVLVPKAQKPATVQGIAIFTGIPTGLLAFSLSSGLPEP
jgi:hypothetical protein